LQEEIAERKEKLERLSELRRGIRDASMISIETIGDVAAIMENKKKLSNMRRNLLIPGILLSILQLSSILLWIFKGIWQLFALWAILAIPFGIIGSRYYYRSTAYICPQCHEVFRPSMKEAFFAKHTMRTRRLTCLNCGHHGFCVETWGGDIR